MHFVMARRDWAKENLLSKGTNHLKKNKLISKLVASNMTDETFERQAMDLLDNCEEKLKVGAVLAKDGCLLSTGFRGEVIEDDKPLHAERIAIEKSTGNDTKGSTLYTTLEPCIEINVGQKTQSCASLIVEKKIKRVVIGVLDPRAEVYTHGVRKLLDANIIVDYFPEDMRELIEGKSFKDVDTNVGYGPSGKRWVAVVASGKNYSIFKSRSSDEKIAFVWQSLQAAHGCVDVVASSGGNKSITAALNMKKFDEIADWKVFREPRHFCRMKKGTIAVLHSQDSTWAVLIRLVELKEDSIEFQWQVRD